MFDFAWSELAVIAVVALVVIGPKDLPRVMRTVGFWVRRARAVAREFQSSIDQMVREAELEEVKEKYDSITNFDIGREVTRAVDPGGEIEQALQAPVVEEPMIAKPAPAAAAPSSAPPPAEPEKTEPEKT
jgi:sec-independent protein translocase protein TatB